MGTTQTK